MKMTKTILEKMYEDHNVLMEKIREIIDSGDEAEKKKYYDASIHHYITQNCWEILLPLDKKEWSKQISEFHFNYEKRMSWPNYTAYCYSMDVLFPPNFPCGCLYFGYAVMEDNTVLKTAFLHWFKMVDYQAAPQGIVMDPLADMHGIKPKYYVGSPVEREDIESFILLKKPGILERYVQRRNKKEHEQRLHDSYMEAYYNQMAYEPHYLPRALREFAQRERLPFPDDQRSDK